VEEGHEGPGMRKEMVVAVVEAEQRGASLGNPGFGSQ
jgi:hypothetical protein